MGAMIQLNILVAEDDALNRQLITEIIKKLGHHCFSVRNGAEAVACYEQQRFDLVLLDLQMPVLDGTEALSSMRRIDAKLGIHTPMAVLSGETQTAVLNSGVLSNFDAYLGKPFTPSQVAHLIEQFFPQGSGLTGREVGGSGRTIEKEFSEGERAPFLEDPRMEAALEKTHGDLLFFETLLKKFERKFRETLQTAGNAIEAHDQEEAQRVFHGLKGELTIFNAEDALRSLEVLETAVRSPDRSQGWFDTRRIELEDEIQSMIQTYKVLIKRKNQN